VLDWKKDRANGAFTAAREKHDKTVRELFSKAGFKDDVLVEEVFCSRLLQSMINPTAGQQQSTTAFKPLPGNLEAIPVLEIDGTIRIDFSCDEKQNRESRYSGTLILDPKKFNPTWFRQAAKRHATAYKRGDDLVMELDDGSWWKSPLYLSIEYHPLANEKTPSAEDSKERFKNMLNILAGCLKE